MPETPSLEEQVFGPRWKTALCKPYQAREYFQRRFDLGVSAYYEILSPLLVRVRLAPENAKRRPGKSRRTTGLVMFAAHVVEECDRLVAEAEARARARAASRAGSEGKDAPGEKDVGEAPSA